MCNKLACSVMHRLYSFMIIEMSSMVGDAAARSPGQGKVLHCALMIGENSFTIDAFIGGGDQADDFQDTMVELFAGALMCLKVRQPSEAITTGNSFTIK